MSNEAPESFALVPSGKIDSDGRIAVDHEEQYVIIVPKAEWDAHRERVEAMTNLINGVINGLASNPLFMSMVPPDVLAQMRGKL